MFFVGFLCRFGCGGGVRVGVAPEETAVLVGWRRRSGSRVLAGMKAEAVLHASRGVDAGVIAGMVERAERTVQEWPADWRATRMRRVPAGHAGNQDAAEPARARKQEPKAVLAQPPSRRASTAGVMNTAGSNIADRFSWTHSTGTSTINQMSYFGTRTVHGLTNFTAKNTAALWGSGITGASIGMITDSIPIP